jgi:UDP-N-acetylmuramoyl-tripeptide--D-alanyl-D-alanine ligase
MISSTEIYELFRKYPEISTDSRRIVPGSLFFAIRGENFDGNNFAYDALEKGASYAIIDNADKYYGNRTILVDNTITALQELASIHRDRVRARIIGITGSNGKTTTKELIGRVLSSEYKIIATAGNLNNHIGVPLTVLSINPETDFAIVEMGANHPGEIAHLCQIAKPGFGIITNIGKAHLEGFGSFEGVLKAKSELYDYIRQHNGLVFINKDNHLLVNLSGGLNLSFYGTGNDVACKGEITGREPWLTVKWTAGNRSGSINSQLLGDYNFENILAAVNIGLHFGISPGNIDNSIGSYSPDNNRSQWLNTGRNMLILDAYNANPSSMKAALDNFHNMVADSKTVILGDMMELGEHSLAEHREILSFARRYAFNEIILIGEFFSKVSSGRPEKCFPDLESAKAWLRKKPITGSTILLKGSRKMQLESLISFL